MFNIRASHQEEDLVAMNAALGDVSEGVFFNFADRRVGSAQVNAGVFGPRGVALASYQITESTAELPGAATHIKFERPLSGVIFERHGEIEMTADPETSILSSPGDCEMFWQPQNQAVQTISMSLPVAVLQDFIAAGDHALTLNNTCISFDGAHAAHDKQFVDLMSYILDHFERFAAMPKQGDMAEALLLETFVDMAHGAGFLEEPETAGLRRGSRGGDADARLVARAEEFIRENFDEPVTMPQLAKALGVNLRKLQMTFREHRGITPRMFLSAVRLEQAKKRLMQPGLRCNVTAVAIDCGFVHLGRFSKAYMDAFGEYPSDTLNRSQHGL